MQDTLALCADMWIENKIVFRPKPKKKRKKRSTKIAKQIKQKTFESVCLFDE